MALFKHFLFAIQFSPLFCTKHCLLMITRFPMYFFCVNRLNSQHRAKHKVPRKKNKSVIHIMKWTTIQITFQSKRLRIFAFRCSIHTTATTLFSVCTCYALAMWHDSFAYNFNIYLPSFIFFCVFLVRILHCFSVLMALFLYFFFSKGFFRYFLLLLEPFVCYLFLAGIRTC